MPREPTRRTVLVVGAHGFLGGCIVTRLRQSGWRVLCGVRDPQAGSIDERRCNFAAMRGPADWHAALTGVDAVVNVAGILRESRGQSFEAVHVQGPFAMAQACAEAGIGRFVQISALGDPRDGAFVASKHRGDAALLALPLCAVVLRPSVVYATEGSRGGTSLLRALAALPFGTWLPGDGRWPMQPLAAQDLAELVARALTSDAAGMFEVGGPTLALREYQHAWRRWLRIPGARDIHVPQWLVSLQIAVSERLGRGPMTATIWRMLQRGNVTQPTARERLMAAFGFAPRPLDDVLVLHPVQVQDRWHARLYFLAPLLRSAVIALWLISGVSGWLAPAVEIEALTGHLPYALEMARLAGAVDVALAAWLASGWRPRWVLTAMFASVVVYTFAFSAWSPSVWLAPLGGLAKNLVVAPALAVLWVLADKR